METKCRDRNDDLEHFRESGGGSVCLRGEHSLPDFLFSVACLSGSGCTATQMPEDMHKCFSGEDFASGHLKKIKNKIKGHWETVMLIAPKWPSRLWFPVIVKLLAAALWPISLQNMWQL